MSVEDAAAPSEVYGPLVSGAMVEDAVERLLLERLPEYLAEGEAQHGMKPGTLRAPRSWTRSNDIDQVPIANLPCVLIMCAATDQVARDGDAYAATWPIGVAGIVGVRAAADRAEGLARRAAQVYAACLRSCLIERGHDLPMIPGVDDLAGSVVGWSGEGYRAGPRRNERTIAAGVVTVEVLVPETARVLGGPDAAPADPYDRPIGWPTAREVTLSLDMGDPE